MGGGHTFWDKKRRKWNNEKKENEKRKKERGKGEKIDLNLTFVTTLRRN